jgi:AcrR family transcriptional regulator
MLATEPRKRRATAAPKRRREDANSRKAEIINVAVRLIREKGYKAARLEDVAKELSISRPTIYHHLESKEDILREIHDQTVNGLAEVASAIGKADLPPEEKLRRFIVTHSTFVMQNRDRAAVFYQETAHLPKRSAARLKKKRQEMEDVVKGIIEDGVQDGVFRDLNVDVVTNAILGMCNWTFHWFSPDGPLSPEAIGEIFADMISQGYVSRRSKDLE